MSVPKRCNQYVVSEMREVPPGRGRHRWLRRTRKQRRWLQPTVVQIGAKRHAKIRPFKEMAGNPPAPPVSDGCEDVPAVYFKNS